MNLNSTYFYTATILNWCPLLQDSNSKNVIIESLSFLTSTKKSTIYGFVIMPNHIHLIWKNIEMNGKEYPDESFLKFTVHQFKKKLNGNDKLKDRFRIDKIDRTYQFWQRSPLPIEIFSREMLEQKLGYTHLNPLQSHWNLVTDPNDYLYSSCSFYERNDDKFKWLTDYREDF